MMQVAAVIFQQLNQSSMIRAMLGLALVCRRPKPSRSGSKLPQSSPPRARELARARGGSSAAAARRTDRSRRGIKQMDLGCCRRRRCKPPLLFPIHWLRKCRRLARLLLLRLRPYSGKLARRRMPPPGLDPFEWHDSIRLDSTQLD